MNIKIDEHGFVYIKRGIMWRPQQCKLSPRSQEACRDDCPLLSETGSGIINRINFRCSGYEHQLDTITEDYRMRRKITDKEQSNG